MARKRKLDASLPPEVTEETVPKPAMGGMWAGSAMNLLKQRIEETHGSVAQGILNGTVALRLDPFQIEDAVGSDRVGHWTDDPAFEALKANIARRGQTQPVRVRPKRSNWVPKADAPFETDDRFIVQSGRRRIEACRQLGLPVLAILSTDKGDAALADLEERFHENTMRENLSGFEELLSIGLLAESLSDLTQEDIANRLSVSQNDVSLGMSCVAMRDQILASVDITKEPKRAYRAIIPKLRRGEVDIPAKVSKPKLISGIHADISVDMIPVADGMTVKIKGAGLDAISSPSLARDIGRLLARYRKERG